MWELENEVQRCELLKKTESQILSLCSPLLSYGQKTNDGLSEAEAEAAVASRRMKLMTVY